MIKMVNQLIHQAVESGASDIHIEPFEGVLKVRYRIDGVLREVDAPPSASTAAVISMKACFPASTAAATFSASVTPDRFRGTNE